MAANPQQEAVLSMLCLTRSERHMCQFDISMATLISQDVVFEAVTSETEVCSAYHADDGLEFGGCQAEARSDSSNARV